MDNLLQQYQKAIICIILVLFLKKRLKRTQEALENDIRQHSALAALAINAPIPPPPKRIRYNAQKATYCDDNLPSWYEKHLDSAEDAEWVEHFRMTKHEFFQLHADLQADLLLPFNRNLDQDGKTERHARPSVRNLHTTEMLAMTLHRLASGTPYKVLAAMFKTSKGTACRATEHALMAINNFKENEIYWPSPDEQHELGILHGAKYGDGFEKIVGAIDGSVIQINTPQLGEEAYYSGKDRFCCVKVQAVVALNGRCLDLLAGEFGARHDASMLYGSELYQNIDSLLCPGYAIAGDSGYPSRDWLITPYGNHDCLTPEHTAFNVRFSSMRVVVEQWFGKCKQLWGIIGKGPMPSSPWNYVLYVNACFILTARLFRIGRIALDSEINT